MLRLITHRNWCVALVLLGCLFVGSQELFAQKTHRVWYKGSENELHIYRVFGSKPGKTLMLIGGIQGDEPGGFLAADLYADFSLEKGNLIVVPRANFPSILLKKRKINEDMNRKFADDHTVNYEARVVKVLKELIQESDCLLNLHEGSGVYSTTWESPMKNPRRYGQSIIADTDIFEDKSNGIKIDLAGMAKSVIKKINSHIKDPYYFFHFNNHKTHHRDSSHKEQRKSATYYALYGWRIPAFGIESAKSLPLEQKVRQHIYAINGFMELLDIIPETPGVDLTEPELKYMVVSINDAVPVVLENLQRLQLLPNDFIEVLDIIVNYKRGLSVDILGLGSEFNDIGRKVAITQSTRIVAKKDFYPCGSVFIDLKSSGDAAGADKIVVSDSGPLSSKFAYRIQINGKPRVVDDGRTVSLKRGDTLRIVDVITAGIDPSKCIVNFKGFVGNKVSNTGEDRGYLIDTKKDVLMKRYSLNKKGKRFYIVTTLDNKELSRLYIRLTP